MNSMLAALRQYLTPQLLSSAAQLVDEPQDKVAGAFSHILPLLLASVGQQAGHSENTSKLANLFKSAPPPESLVNELTGNTAANLANDEKLVAGGQQFLSTLFANNSADIVQKLAQTSQLKTSSISSLLQMAAPLVMGFLGQQLSQHQGSVNDLLTGLKNSDVTQGLPSAISQLITSSPTVAAAQADASSMVVKKSWLQPLVALLILGLLALVFLKSCHQSSSEMTTNNNGLNRGSDSATTNNTMSSTASEAMPPVTVHDDKLLSLSPTLQANASLAASTASGGQVTASQPQWNVQQSGDSAVNNIQNKLAQLGAFFTKILPNGKSLNIPQFGVENKLLNFIENQNQTVDKTTWFSFDRLTFASGSSQLLRQSQEQLTNIAAILRAYPKVNIKLGGYTDNVGNDADNLRLSQGRADAVRQALIKLGIAPRRITAEGYGAAHPVASNDTEQGRAQNRRIDIRVIQK